MAVKYRRIARNQAAVQNPTAARARATAVQRAAEAEAERAEINFMGTAEIADLAGRSFDLSVARVAASFIRLLTKQFQTHDFIDTTGYIQLRRLPPVIAPLSAAGAFIAASFLITAPSDRYQLVLQPVIKVQGPDATAVVPYEDMAILNRDGILRVNRPQSKSVDESFDTYNSGGEQMEFDPLTGDPFMEQNMWTLNRAMPHGLGQAIDYAFAGLPPTNVLELEFNNLANAGALVPSGGDLQAFCLFNVMDAVKG